MATIFVHTVDLDRQPAPAAAGPVSQDERDRAARFRRPRDGYRWLAARAALHRVLGGHLGIAPEALRYTFSGHGKPALDLAGPPLHFNLSHSGRIALIAVTRHAPVGVDVEREKPLPDWRAVASRFFSPAERAQLEALDAADRQRGFYRCWTRKEALIKATGEGLSADLASFDVSLTAPAVLADRSPAGGVRHWQLVHLDPEPGYLGAVAIASREPVAIEHRTAAAQRGG